MQLCGVFFCFYTKHDYIVYMYLGLELFSKWLIVFFFLFLLGIGNNLIYLKRGYNIYAFVRTELHYNCFNINSGVSASEFDKLHVEINFLIGNAWVDESHLILTNIVFIYWCLNANSFVLMGILRCKYFNMLQYFINIIKSYYNLIFFNNFYLLLLCKNSLWRVLENCNSIARFMLKV